MFRTRGDLYLLASRKMIGRAAGKVKASYPELMPLDEQLLLERVEPILSAVAFAMMKEQRYGYAVRGVNDVGRVRRSANHGINGKITPQDWHLINAISDLTNRCILEGSTTQILSFKHRGMMEFYCGLHLAENAQAGWVAQGEDGVIRCGDAALQRFAANSNWYWAFRFAIELPASVWQDAPDVLTASLAELFQVPPLPPQTAAIVTERPKPLPRPTELMYRAWPLLDAELVDPARRVSRGAESRFAHDDHHGSLGRDALHGPAFPLQEFHS
jgi:hypothetical protein